MGNSGSRLRFWRRHRKSPCPQSNGHSDNPRPQVPDTYAHDQVGSPFPNDGQGPHGSVSLPAIPFVELQKAVVIRNDVNIKKESLCVEPDEDNPGKFLVSFVLDASAAGSFLNMLHKYLARTLALPDRFEWKKKMVGGSGGMPEMLIRGNEVFEHFLAFLSFSLQKKAQIVR